MLCRFNLQSPTVPSASPIDEATSLSADITGARGKLDTTLYPHMARDSISRLDPRLPVALRVGDFQQILKLANAARVGPGLPNLEFLRVRLADFASGMQAVIERNLPESERFLARFDTELRRINGQNDGAAHTAGITAPQTADVRLAQARRHVGRPARSLTEDPLHYVARIAWFSVLQGFRLIAIGVTLGIGAALGFTSLIAHLLYRVQQWDPVIFISAPLALGAVALLAIWIPARRAAQVDPLVALRYQ